jgi:asparagine synthase (glutamine-hydrolysing)
MCGIAGIIGYRDRDQATADVEAMKFRLRHRGPDGEGTWVADAEKGNCLPVAFGHRRLSIIDLSDLGAQPMTTVDGRFTITFNGEIYNYRELRRECEALGSRFRSQSDTEVAMECYRHWGALAFARFSGMWAMAIYDSHAREVALSRDPFGIKPLYYAFHGGALCFASEPQALLAVSHALGEVDEVTVRLFTEFGHLDRGDWTFYRRIKRFPHAHYCVLPADKPLPATLSCTRYWQPPAADRRIGKQEAVAEFQRLLTRSVEMHLRSDVPVGSCLSGGLDSSAVVGIGSRLLPPGQPFRTFTTRFPDFPEIDESDYAAAVIAASKARPVFVAPDADFFRENFADVVACQGEPFGSTSIFSQYAVFQAIGAAGVKVVLDGQGADEILGGYHGFLPIYLETLLGQGRPLRYLHEWYYLHRNYGPPLVPGIGRAVRNAWAAVPALAGRRGAARRPAEAGATNAAVLDELHSRLRQAPSPEDFGTFEEMLTCLTCESNLPQLLRYEDRDSMAHGVEARVPFLEPQLVAFVLSLPASLRISRGVTKMLLREAVRGTVPEAVRLRRSKLGFPAPERQWLRKAFQLDVDGAGSRTWRDLVLENWRTGLEEEQTHHACRTV